MCLRVREKPLSFARGALTLPPDRQTLEGGACGARDGSGLSGEGKGWLRILLQKGGLLGWAESGGAWFEKEVGGGMAGRRVLSGEYITCGSNVGWLRGVGGGEVGEKIVVATGSLAQRGGGGARSRCVRVPSQTQSNGGGG